MTTKPPAAPPQDRHLRDYWRVVWNGRWTVLALFTAVLVMGTVATLLQRPVFESAVTLELNARPRGMVPGAEVAQLGATEFGYLAEERYFNTQFQIIRSRTVAESAMGRLGLLEHPAFAGESDPVEAFIRRIVVEPVQETGVVRVRIRAPGAQQAMDWSNALATTYVERNLDEAIKNTEEAVAALVQRLQPLRDELLAREQERFSFAGEQQLYLPEDSQLAIKERLSLLEKDLTETEVKRVELQGVYDRVKEIEREDGDFLVLPRVAGDPTIRGLTEDRIRYETELRRLLVTFKPGHYKVKEKESELEKVQQKIAAEVQRIVGAIRTEYSLLASREEEIRAAVQETRKASLALGQTASEYDIRRTESSETRRVYDQISTKIKEVQLNTHLLRNNVSIIDEAILPTGPVSPNRRLNVALSAALGLLLGLGTVFFLEYLDNTVKTSDDVERYLAMSILAIIPRRSAASEAMLRESYQSLRTNLNFSSLNRTRRVVLVTSAGPQEGKTSTVVALARAQASSGERVVLVDCDLRRPNVHNHLNLKRNFGLTNYLADGSEDSSWRKYLKTTDVPNLSVLTCGPIPPNAPELFGTERFRRLLEEMKQEYQWVLLDAPPVATITDSVILASLAEMVALVIRHRENDKELIRRCVETLRGVNPHVIGAILNDVDLDRSHYRDYYYAGYNYYQSAEKEEGGERRRRLLGGRRAG